MAIDWTKSMSQDFEYYTVNADSWCDTERLDNITSCTINRDSETETLGSASIDMTETIGESYIRVYLIATQGDETEKACLGTFLVQTPSSDFDGKLRTVSADAYTPLLELKENPPDLGYTVAQGKNVMQYAYTLTAEHARAPVVEPNCEIEMYSDFVANTDDTWLSFLTDLIENAEYKFGLDEDSRIIFMPDQEVESMQPVWTYDDDNSSILYPEISMDHDLYGIPNVVEVVYSSDTAYYTARVVNDDANSPISTVNRGREIVYRDTSPSLPGAPTETMIEAYAKTLLQSLSEVEYTLSYTHGYCPVRLGDCVRLNYEASGITDVKAKVTYQSISCEPGCPVSEKAVFTTKLWE